MRMRVASGGALDDALGDAMKPLRRDFTRRKRLMTPPAPACLSHSMPLLMIRIAQVILRMPIKPPRPIFWQSSSHGQCQMVTVGVGRPARHRDGAADEAMLPDDANT